jgi:hypothetical protein
MSTTPESSGLPVLQESMILMGQRDSVTGEVRPFLKNQDASFWFSSMMDYTRFIEAAVPRFSHAPIAVSGWKPLLETGLQLEKAGCQWGVINPGPDGGAGTRLVYILDSVRRFAER